MSDYPTREQAAEAWQALAAEIAADVDRLTDTTAREPTSAPGELVILGSGIGVMGFARDAEQYIDEADHVFFCLTDPATQVWLREKRPDARDLYVLYKDGKRRYATYIQMSEAMLHYVRKGRRVVAVYYGHPGIFVLSTHRAIAIARREGHEARMLPGISALDCLCADLGVDPAYPGLQTFEATDMLLRRRAVDIHSHVVLWQVGLIAEMGFRRRGFHNRNFDHLVDYLLGYYPETHPVTHYVASKYPTLPPVIEQIPLGELAEPEHQRRLSGVSTFYIPPARGRAIDVDFAREVGLVRPGQKTGLPTPLRHIARYSPRELAAIEQLEDFRVPADYHFQRETGAARFVLALAEDPALRRAYVSDPVSTVNRFPGLDAKERSLLARRTRRSVQLAAKGAATAITAAEQFVVDLVNQPSLRKSWMSTLTTAVKAKPKDWSAVDSWLNARYPGVTLAEVGPAVGSVQSWLLMMWNGIYAGSGSTPDVLVINANSSNDANGAGYLNASPLYKVTFQSATLKFLQSHGNPCNGEFTFSSSNSTYSVSGYTWMDGSSKPSSPNFSGTLQKLPTNPLSVWCGEYTTTVSGGGAGPNVAVFLPDETNPQPYLVVGTTTVTDGTFDGTTYTWDSGASAISFSIDSSGRLTFTGTIQSYGSVDGTAVSGSSSAFDGQYTTQILQTVGSNQVWSPYYPCALQQSGGTTTFSIGQNDVTATYQDRHLTWSGGPKGIQNGDVYFAVNSLNHAPFLSGVVWNDGTAKPTAPNFQGVLNPNALANFAGEYQTTLNGAASDALTIAGTTGSNTTVTWGSTSVSATFNAGVMRGLAGTDSLVAAFGYDGSGDTVQTEFTGSITPSGGDSQAWASSSISNDMRQWAGSYDSRTASPTNGSQVPGGPMVTITASSASSFTVVLNVDGTDITVSSPTYDASTNVLYWKDQTGAGAYANGAITFYIDGQSRTKKFQGVYYSGSTAPTAINWWGVPHQEPDSPLWPVIVLWSILAGELGVIAFLAWRASRAASSAANSTEVAEEMQHLKCE